MWEKLKKKKKKKYKAFNQLDLVKMHNSNLAKAPNTTFFLTVKLQCVSV